MALCTVTCSLQTVLGDVIQGNAFVRFRLRGFSGAVPRVNGTAILVQADRDVFPDASGNISTDLWGNDSITPENTFYSVDFFNGGHITTTGNYIITGSTFDLDVQDQISPPSTKFPFPLVLETNGAVNSTQSILNLVEGDNTTLMPSTDGSGTVTISSVRSSTRPGGTRWNYANLNNLDSFAGTGDASLGIALLNLGNGIGAFSKLLDATATAGPRWALQGQGNGVGAGNGCTAYDNFNKILGGFGNISLGSLKYWEFQVGIGNALATTGGCWYYIGLADIQPNGGQLIDKDIVLTSNIVGFRFDPVAFGDTTWKAVIHNASGTTTLVDTGVVPGATTGHIFQMAINATSVIFSIDQSPVATIAISSLTAGKANLFYSFATASDQASTTASQANLFCDYLYYETI